MDEQYGAQPREAGYAGPTVAAAVLMSLFFPLILIVLQILLVIGLLGAVRSGSDVGPTVEVP